MKWILLIPLLFIGYIVGKVLLFYGLAILGYWII